MIPAAFDYAVPETLDEAVKLLADHGDVAKVLSGGHSLLPLMKLRLARPEIVVDLRKIAELRGIHRDGARLVLGAAATHAEIAASAEVRDACPLLVETAGRIGDPQVRNAGTIGGSVVHADPAADWPAALLALGATVHLRGASGMRTVPAGEFFVGLLQSAAKTGEILTSVTVPVPETPRAAAYLKMAQSASGFALCGVAVQLAPGGGAAASAAIGITGVAETPYRAADAEAALAGGPLDDARIDAAAAKAVPAGARVLSDVHASEAYRRHLASVFVRRALRAARDRARA